MCKEIRKVSGAIGDIQVSLKLTIPTEDSFNTTLEHSIEEIYQASVA